MAKVIESLENVKKAVEHKKGTIMDTPALARTMGGGDGWCLAWDGGCSSNNDNGCIIFDGACTLPTPTTPPPTGGGYWGTKYTV